MYSVESFSLFFATPSLITGYLEAHKFTECTRLCVFFGIGGFHYFNGLDYINNPLLILFWRFLYFSVLSERVTERSICLPLIFLLLSFQGSASLGVILTHMGVWPAPRMIPLYYNRALVPPFLFWQVYTSI